MLLILSHGQRHIYQLKTQADSLKSGANGDEAHTTPAAASQTPKTERWHQCCVLVLVHADEQVSKSV